MSKKSKKISIGDRVTVVINGKVQDLEIIDLPQGDPKEGKISFLSPIARAILGRCYPDHVVVKLPNGNTVECELLSPSF